MTDHAPIQIDLATRLAAVDIAEKRLATLRDRKSEVIARASAYGNGMDAARAALRDAAGALAANEGDDKAVERAKKALKAAESEHEMATLELEGIAGRIEQAERELKSKRRDMAFIASDVCAMREPILLARTLALWQEIGHAYRELFANRRSASFYTSSASGSDCEPFPYSSETCGLLRIDPYDDGFVRILREHDISERFTPLPNAIATITPAELLELELPRAAEAAE